MFSLFSLQMENCAQSRVGKTSNYLTFTGRKCKECNTFESELQTLLDEKNINREIKSCQSKCIILKVQVEKRKQKYWHENGIETTTIRIPSMHFCEWQYQTFNTTMYMETALCWVISNGSNVACIVIAIIKERKYIVKFIRKYGMATTFQSIIWFT